MNWFADIEFAKQEFLWLLLLIPLFVIWYIRKHKELSSDIRFVHSGFIKNIRKGFRIRMLHLPFVLRMLAMVLLLIALARPQTASSTRDISVEGIDIMITLDISGSMLAEDFSPNRMEAAKRTALDFIDMRPNDRIGVTVFSGFSFTMVPLTTDHTMLKQLAANIRTGMVEDGTAIGDGLATAVNRLRDSDAISRVIVLLTDGINNRGVIDPLTAAEIAALYDIRVYTIGVGSSGPVPYPFQTPYGIRYQDVEFPVDEELLQQIANMTGGQYFWADRYDMLEQVYREIDQLERTKIDVTEFTHHQDEYLPLLILALVLIVAEALLRHTWLKTTP